MVRKRPNPNTSGAHNNGHAHRTNANVGTLICSRISVKFASFCLLNTIFNYIAYSSFFFFSWQKSQIMSFSSAIRAVGGRRLCNTGRIASARFAPTVARFAPLLSAPTVVKSTNRYQVQQPSHRQFYTGPKNHYVNALKNKVCVVTGAASGLGKEIAFEFSRQGAKVVVADVNQTAIDVTVAQIIESGNINGIHAVLSGVKVCLFMFFCTCSCLSCSHPV